MPIRRTRMIGGERFIKRHHDNNDEIKEIMKELKKELDKNRQRRERIRKTMKKIKDIREEKNTLLRQATIRYNNREK